MKIAGKTDIGLVRTENQDAFQIKHINDDTALVVVCDGMGGVSGGNVASVIAVNAITDEFLKKFNSSLSDTAVKINLSEAIRVANNIIYGIALNESQLSGMGTTVVAVLLRNDKALILHAGDSRAYHISDKKISQVTKDHSFVQEMVDLGQLSKEEARLHPKKNIITRALGVSDKIDIEVNTITLDKTDKLLICTDGLTNHVEDDEILELSKNDSPCDAMIELAKERGGSDNITIAMVSVE